MGTLYAGKNYEIDSIFHYCYALVCPVPFALSENNVTKIFHNNSLFLENLGECRFTMKNFIAQLILVIDIYFFDKEVMDFNNLCHAAIVSFKKYLSQYKIPSSQTKTETSININGKDEFIYKITAIFMICLLKLKMNNSSQVHSLHAFLVALCSEIIDCCIERLENFLSIHKNSTFYEIYDAKFSEFDLKIKRARNIYRDQHKHLISQDNAIGDTQDEEKISNYANPIFLLTKKSQEKNSSADEKASSNSSEKEHGVKNVDKKKLNNRRRRRRCRGRYFCAIAL